MTVWDLLETIILPATGWIQISKAILASKLSNLDNLFISIIWNVLLVSYRVIEGGDGLLDL